MAKPFLAWALLWLLAPVGAAGARPALSPSATQVADGQEGPGQLSPGDEEALRRLNEGGIVIQGIEVKGLEAHDPIRIAERLGLRVGAVVPRSIDAAMKRLWDDFFILVASEGYAFEEVEGGVVVHLSLVEMPVSLEPRFAGNVHFDVDQLREWALLDDRVEVPIDEAKRIEDRIRKAYIVQGYHFVEVDHTLGGQGVRRREMVFEIREGPKVYVKNVKLVGNESIPNEGILIWKKTLGKSAKLGTKGRGLFAWWGHRFVEETVQADQIALANQYRERGFLDVVVSYETVFTADRSGVEVTFVIDEGPLYTVSSVDIRAVEFEDVETFPGGRPERVENPAELVIPKDELLELLALSPGDPLEAARTRLDRVRLQDRYGDEGHIPASSFEGFASNAGWQFLNPDLAYDYENHSVAVTYVLQQGRPFVLNMLEIAGNETTKDHVIRSRFASLPGKKVNSREMIEGLRRLLRLQYFDDPYGRGAHPPPSLTYKTVPGQPGLVDAVIRVKEGRTINANLSGGIASDQGLIGIVSLSISNFDAQKLPRRWSSVFGEVYRKEAFTGDGETFGLDISPGSEVSFWRIFYQHPDVFRRYFDPVGFVAEISQRDRIFRSHDEQRTFARLAVTRAFGQGDIQVSAGIRAQEIDISDLDDGDDLPRTVRRSEGEEVFYGLTGSVSANKLDNGRLPRSGWTARWTNTLYAEAFGSDNNLWKSEASYDRYFHLGEDPAEAAPGIYLGLGAGLAVPVNGPKGTVNYGERFFFGGARFGRGFRFRGVGPYEGDFPLGGESYLRSTLEYRFPLYTQTVAGTSSRREVFRGSIFVDAGVLDPSAYELNLGERRVSAGFALGLIEPFPVTFSFGWPIESGPGDERQVFAFSLSLR